MAEQPQGAPIGVSFSVQEIPTGEAMIGIHFDAPLTSYVIAFPVKSAKVLAENFGTQLLATIAEAEKGKSPLVVANGETMNILKKGQN